MTPIQLAPDELLRRLPACAVMASELDPLLDDSIMFVRRLRKLGREKDVMLKVCVCVREREIERERERERGLERG